jgi:hypothetical protein
MCLPNGCPGRTPKYILQSSLGYDLELPLPWRERTKVRGIHLHPFS